MGLLVLFCKKALFFVVLDLLPLPLLLLAVAWSGSGAGAGAVGG